VVHEEDRDRARPRRDLFREIFGGDLPLNDVELKAAGGRDVVHHRIAGPFERQRDRRLMRLPLPDGDGLAVRPSISACA